RRRRVRGRVRPPRVVQRLRTRPRGGGPRPGPSFAGASGDRRAAGGHSPVVPVGLPCGGRWRRLSLGTGLLGLLTACWVKAERGPDVLVLSLSASDPERTSAGSQSRGAVSSCRVLWRTIGLVGPEASPHLDSERIRTRKNRPRIQGANFRWGLPIRDGDTFYFWPPRAPTMVKKREAPAPARWWRGAVKRAAGVSEALRGPPSTKQYVAGLRRQVPLQEGARPVDGTGLQLRRILPGKHRDLGVRRQRGDVNRNLERMGRHVVGQHQHWRLARLREVARHAVHEIGPHAVEAVQVFLDRFHRHVAPALAELLGPDVAPGVEHVV